MSFSSALIWWVVQDVPMDEALRNFYTGVETLVITFIMKPLQSSDRQECLCMTDLYTDILKCSHLMRDVDLVDIFSLAWCSHVMSSPTWQAETQRAASKLSPGEPPLYCLLCRENKVQGMLCNKFFQQKYKSYIVCCAQRFRRFAFTERAHDHVFDAWRRKSFATFGKRKWQARHSSVWGQHSEFSGVQIS